MASKTNTFVILYDKTDGKELGRYKINRNSRSDVQNIYPNVSGSNSSGFSLDISLGSQIISGKQLQVISRYTDASNGEGNYADYRSAPFTLDESIGNTESFKIIGNKLHVSGWHASDAAAGRENSLIMLYNATTKRELARYSINRNTRNDVKAIHPHVYNSSQSGFVFDLPISFDLKNTKLQIISRYSTQSNGEGSYSNYWSPAVSFNSNVGHIDAFKKIGNQIYISGWHASDGASARNNSYVILYDQTNGREITRYKINRNQRSDVGSAYPNIFNSELSGFSLTIPYSSKFDNRKIQIISRYSTQSNGEGSFVDYRSNGYSIN